MGEGGKGIAEKLEKQTLRKEEATQKKGKKSKSDGKIVPHQPIATQ